MKKKDVNVEEQSDEQEKKKKIIMIIILILLLLLLITSCTSNFFGSIGDWFQKEGNYEIDGSNSEKEIITNEDLRLDTDNIEVSLDDPKVKVSYYTNNIDAKNYTCTTSDASIATCYVQDGYIVVNPKAPGSVKVILQAEANGKIYKATATITVTEGSRAIKLSSYSGEMDLNYNQKLYVSYSLVGISGNVTVKSTDDSIATATINNGVVEITGYKAGTVEIIVSLEYGGKTYSSTYKLEVTGNLNNRYPITPGGTSNPGKPGTTNPGNQNPSTPIKDKNNFLSNITISSGTLNFKPNCYEYVVGVSSDVDKVTLNVTTSSNKAKVTYTYNGKTVTSLKDLVLNTGDNKVVIKVTAEDGNTREYTVIINKKASKNNSLSSLTVNKGTLIPGFNENTLNYEVNVSNDTNTITIQSKLSDSKAKVEYKVDGKTVSNLNDIPLKDGKNKVEIIVTSEDGTKRTYTVNVNKALSDNNYLSEIVITDYALNETFDKNKKEYTMNVTYNTEKLSIIGVPEDGRSTVKYILDGKEVSLDQIKLVNKDSVLKIVVTSQSGKENTYQINIHKPERTILLNKDSYTVRLEDTPYSIPYKILEDGIEIDNYDEKDVKVSLSNYQGKYEVKKGFIIIYPDKKEMLGKTAKLEVSYNNQKTSTDLTFTKDNYYLESYADTYTIKLENQTGYRNLILNSNLLTGILKKENIAGGIRLSGDIPDNYIDITTTSDFISFDLADSAETASIAFKVIANKAGTAKIKITGYDLLGKIKEIEFTIIVVNQYTVHLLSNDGIFNDLGETEYIFKVEEGKTLDLSKYKAYKKSLEDECEYYGISSYNTKADGTGNSYHLYNENHEEIKPVNITVTKDMTLYAIYDESIKVELPVERKLYLTDVDLFTNEEYYKLYNIENMIYPGVSGSYKMNFKNTSDNDIEIIGITLEEDTLCVSEGCLNMGYNIRYAEPSSYYHYYYGSSVDNVMKYKILNREVANPTTHNKKEIRFPVENRIPVYHDSEKGAQEIEITLFWKWVDEQKDTEDKLVDADKIDTLIGNSVTDLNNKYALTLSIDYRIINDKCEKP